MTLDYWYENLHSGIYRIATSTDSLQERIASAYCYDFSSVYQFPKETPQDIRKIGESAYSQARRALELTDEEAKDCIADLINLSEQLHSLAFPLPTDE